MQAGIGGLTLLPYSPTSRSAAAPDTGRRVQTLQLLAPNGILTVTRGFCSFASQAGSLEVNTNGLGYALREAHAATLYVLFFSLPIQEPFLAGVGGHPLSEAVYKHL